MPDFDSMNETDVREIIVRPLLHELGYRHGTEAHIRTEYTLRYAKAFLGRKNPKSDPPLTGRADYICDAISFGRWAVEVKGPAIEMTADVVEQAHTYAAHPEIAAYYFMVTNGRRFAVYEIGNTTTPVLAWSYDETSAKMMNLRNLLGYDAIKRRASLLRLDPEKPLGPGLPSKLRIVGGEVTYGDHFSSVPILNSNAMRGLVGSVTGNSVSRDETGRLWANVTLRSPIQQWDAINKLAGFSQFDFYSSQEFISTDVENPSIFQNVKSGSVAVGTGFALVPGGPEIPLPYGFDCDVYSHATGYLQDGEFKGSIYFDYHYRFIHGPKTGNPQVDFVLSQIPAEAVLEGDGTFIIHFRNG